MHKKNILNYKTFFYGVILFAVFTLLMMFLDDLMDVIGKGVFAVWILLTISGIGLIVTTLKEKISGKKKLFFLVTGYAAAGFFIFGFLHNALYALGTITGHLTVINAILGFLGATFFLAAVILCPLGLIVGVVASFILWNKQT